MRLRPGERHDIIWKDDAAMSDQDDLAELGPRLASVDLDGDTADRIRRLGRDGVVYGPPLARFVLPVATTVLTTSYLVWAVLKIIDVFR
jgi:hypothetical protein